MTTLTAPELHLFWSLHVAGRVGIAPPSTDYARWLRLHRDQAEACMGLADYKLMVEQIGDVL